MLSKQLLEAEKTVLKYSFASTSTSAIPFPLVDIAILSAIQLKMLQSLTKTYATPFKENTGKALIASLLGGSVPFSFSTHLVRVVPVYGMLVGFVSRSVFSGASTYAIGKVFIHHFESGGTILNFDIEQMRSYYQQQFEEGKLKARHSFVGVKP